MISQRNYDSSYIEQLRKTSGNDPALIERVLFAFGLLEALRKVDMPFIFKGGTCLMLLLDETKRLSTDIDILVEPDIDIDSYLEKVGKIFPFERKEEHFRKGMNNITKRHFKFYYSSPQTGKPFHILLDVVFGKNPYSTLINREITNKLLLTEDRNLFVYTPSINSILGDKLSAFAPNTTGIPYGVDKDMEIIKQMFDISCLIDVFDDQKEVLDVYKTFVEIESEFRGRSYSFEDCLKDTITTCICIASRGKRYKENYKALLYGIRGIKSHIYGTRYSGEIAAGDACKVLFFSSCLISGQSFYKIKDEKNYLKVNSLPEPFNSAMAIRKINPIAFCYLVESSKCLKGLHLF